jgi:hypothetical protein
VEGSCFQLIESNVGHLLGGTEKTTKIISQECQISGRDSNLSPPEQRSAVLPLEATCSLSSFVFLNRAVRLLVRPPMCCR